MSPDVNDASGIALQCSDRYISVTLLPNVNRAGSEKVILKLHAVTWKLDSAGKTFYDFTTPKVPWPAADVEKYTGAIHSLKASFFAVILIFNSVF